MTDTERSVVALVVDGLTNREIGTRLFVSRHTVDFHPCSVDERLRWRRTGTS